MVNGCLTPFFYDLREPPHSRKTHLGALAGAGGFHPCPFFPDRVRLRLHGRAHQRGYGRPGSGAETGPILVVPGRERPLLPCGRCSAFAFKKRRAFCRIACPVSLVMKAPAAFSMIRKKPSGNPCSGCGICNKECPMDVDVRGYIQNGLKVLSTECILCGKCSQVCPNHAIS
jgi:Pyruvate/2-oxoacid:ferredoxin oxidoreductase delta subunit